MTSPLPGYSSHFGVDNIPYGVASTPSSATPECVSRFEDTVIFLTRLDFSEISQLPPDVFARPSLNKFAALPQSVQQAVRRKIQGYIHHGLPQNATDHISAVFMHLPVECGDFTDFSTSEYHMRNMSLAIMGAVSIPPSFYYQPIGYGGRCSSLDISGNPVERPLGQYAVGKPGESDVIFGPSQKIDYELELGAIIGRPIDRFQRVVASKAEDHIFGYVLVNDWSARDIQGLESIPLGPLNSKNLGTTLSPWVITTEALRPFKAPSPPREKAVAVHLQDSGNESLNIDLMAYVSPAEGEKGVVICRTNSTFLYWTLAQCVAHHVIGGCGLRTGDLLASGTVSGSGDERHGCLMEFIKPGGSRDYIHDGESVIMTGFCADGVGFGECVATVTPARNLHID